MSKSRIHIVTMLALLLAGTVPLFAQTVAAKTDEGKLIAVLKSSSASRKEKTDACRQLAIIGTKDAIAPLAALLGDEELSHMVRYALEPIPDPAVDAAFREALGELKGKPLVGVIASIGVRRDAKAIEPLKKMLMEHDAGPEVTQAALRALGDIGNLAAAELLQTALAHAPDENQLALCEGLLRCAEALAADGHRPDAMRIYDQLRRLDTAHQVRGGALRGAILTRGEDGLPLLRESLKSDDYILFSAAVQAAQEMPGTEVTKVLTAGLSERPADHQIVIIQTLGLRGDKSAQTALFIAATGPSPLRVAAIQALAEIGDPTCTSVLVGMLDDTDREVAQAAHEALGALPGGRVDTMVMDMFKRGAPDKQAMALELMGRRRMTDSIPTLLEAARGGANIRPAVIRMVGELGGPDQLPALLDLLADLERRPDLAAAEQALAAVCTKADDPQSHADELVSKLDGAKTPQKTVLLRVLGVIGGPDALKAVRGAVDSSDAEVRAAAIRALGTWKTADAAPHLIALAKSTDNQSERTLCLRGYLNLAARGDMPTAERLSMCRQAADIIQRDDEKKLLLGALSSIESPETLGLIMPHLDDPGIRDEAGMAAVTLAERLLKGRNGGRHAAAVIESLEKVTQAEINDDLARRAKAVLRQARSRAGNN